MNSQSLEVAVGEHLHRIGRTVVTAESCTGGLVAHRLTEVAGSSAYVLGGIVAYSNAVKEALLGVDPATLEQYGAVSEPVAAQMALGARRRLKSDYAVSVTGIAGPGGATHDKPVGLTYIGVVGPDNTPIVERHVWTFDRSGNKAASAEAALRLLLTLLDRA
jgi:PncC family amidohydrolase